MSLETAMCEGGFGVRKEIKKNSFFVSCVSYTFYIIGVILAMQILRTGVTEGALRAKN